MIRVTLISTAHSAGQLHLSSGPHREQGSLILVTAFPGQWCISGGWDTLQEHPSPEQPMTHSREDDTGGHWLLPIFWAPHSRLSRQTNHSKKSVSFPFTLQPLAPVTTAPSSSTVAEQPWTVL